MIWSEEMDRGVMSLKKFFLLIEIKMNCYFTLSTGGIKCGEFLLLCVYCLRAGVRP